MHFEGNLSVLRNLLEKRALLAAGDPRHTRYRTALAIRGGALCGTYCAGQLAALHDCNLTDAFDSAYTASTGTPAAAFFFAGQVHEGREIYWRECVTDRFLSLRRYAVWRSGLGQERAMDIDYLGGVFHGNNERGTKLDVGALQNARTAFYAAATGKNGRGALIDMRSTPQPIDAIKASIAIPGLSRGGVDVDGETYYDGEAAYPFPALAALEREEPTDILVLANCPKPKDGSGDKPVSPDFLRELDEKTRGLFATKHQRFVTQLNALRAQSKCRYLILWTDGAVDPFDRNATKLEAASRRAESHLGALLAECEAYVDCA